MRGRAGRVQGEAQLALFLGWKELAARSRKCRALLNRIRNAPAMLAWERWVEYMCTDGMWWEPGPELQAALQAKCGRVRSREWRHMEQREGERSLPGPAQDQP